MGAMEPLGYAYNQIVTSFLYPGLDPVQEKNPITGGIPEKTFLLHTKDRLSVDSLGFNTA